MRVTKLEDLSVYQRSSYFTSLFNRAVQNAKERNRKLGLPNDFVVNNQRFYELPNGEITTINPLADYKPENPT